jgi:transposase
LIDEDEVLIGIVGEWKVDIYKDVHLTQMRVARLVKLVIAGDLDGVLPTTGKQYLSTRRGLFRLAARGNSDNTTEQAAHRRAGAQIVQIFGNLSTQRQSEGWMTVTELYKLHRVRFDDRAMLAKIIQRYREDAER